MQSLLRRGKMNEHIRALNRQNETIAASIINDLFAKKACLHKYTHLTGAHILYGSSTHTLCQLDDIHAGKVPDCMPSI